MSRRKKTRLLNSLGWIAVFFFSLLFSTGLVLTIKNLFTPPTMMIIGLVGLGLLLLFGIISKGQVKNIIFYR